MEIAGQIWCLHRLLAGKHLICITYDRIDLTIVYDEAVWMSTHPAWICVSTESGMHNCNCRNIILILQIHKEGTKLSNQEHSFINDRTAGTGNNISILAALLLKHTACHIQLTVKVKSFLNIIRSLYKALHNIRHALQRLVTENVRLDRNLSPAEELHAFLLCDHLKHTLCLIAL